MICGDVHKIYIKYRTTMGGLVLVYFLVFSLRFCCRCNWNDWLMHLGQLLNHEHNLSLVKYNFLIMAVGDERERLESHSSL